MFKDNLELLKEYIGLVEKHDPYLLEGLIVTRSTDSVEKMLRNWYENIMNISEIKIKDGSFVLTFSKFSKNSNFERLFRYMNNAGYFCASFSNRNNIRLKFKNEEDFMYRISENLFPVTMVFEAKYDVAVNINSKVQLFHVTNSKNIENILKIGLVPKSKSKIATHPERIYLTKSLESAKDMVENFQELQPNETFVILKIDIFAANDERIKFYNDTNFTDEGVYTYWNIPPKAITKI